MIRDHHLAKGLAATNLARSSEPDNPRLDRFVLRSQGPLDLVALFTAWFFLVPTSRLVAIGMGPAAAWAVRGTFLVLFLGHFLVCAALSHHHAAYVRTHPFGLLAGIFPPLRFLLSLAILRWVFRKGHVGWFLSIAAVVLANLTVAMYFWEDGARGANITSVGDAFWCAVATVTTTGYGDATPVTSGGRVMAVMIMGLGVLSLAVITATVSSTFMEQARTARAARQLGLPDAEAEAADAAPAQDANDGVVEDLVARLARIEALLEQQAGGSAAT
ncbi:MAG: potassium channel family protein [Actinomycetes bacterium]